MPGDEAHENATKRVHENVRVLRQHGHRRRRLYRPEQPNASHEDKMIDKELDGRMNAIAMMEQVSSDEDLAKFRAFVASEDNGSPLDPGSINAYVFGCLRKQEGMSNQYCTPVCAGSLTYGVPGTCDGQVWLLAGDSIFRIQERCDVDGSSLTTAYVFIPNTAFHLSSSVYQTMYNEGVRVIKVYNYHAEDNRYDLMFVKGLQRNDEIAEIEAVDLQNQHTDNQQTQDGTDEQTGAGNRVNRTGRSPRQTTDTTEVPWYQNPWIWIAIAAAVILVIVAVTAVTMN